MNAKTLRIPLLGALLTLAVACAPNLETRGYVPQDEDIATVKPGETTKNEVAALLGSPSSIATFSEQSDTWYYISQNVEQFAFFSEEVKGQEVVEIKFDENGVVSNVKQYGMDDREEIEVVERTTPTRGRELGLFEQLFGNLGRFNNPTQKGPPSL